MPLFPPYTPHTTDNVAAVMGVEGTLGTADTAGTARPLPVSVNPDTGAMYVQDIVPGTVGNISAIGTIGTLGIGSVDVRNFAADIPGGTLDLITRVGNIGTLEVGTVSNINAIGTLGTLGIGSIHVTNTPSVSLPDPVGSVVITVGTVTTGSLTNLATLHNGTVDVTDRAARDLGKVDIASFDVDLPGGTVDLVTRVGNLGTLEVGTISSLPDLPGGTLDAGTVVVSTINADLPGGTVDSVTDVGDVSNVTTGTLARVGTLQNLDGGTVQIDSYAVRTGTSYGTLGTAGAATWGTLIAAAGAGTEQRVQGLSMVVASGTVDCAVTFGTFAGPNGANVLARGQFVPGGGIARDFTSEKVSPANGTITFWLGGAGTVFFTVDYYQAA